MREFVLVTKGLGSHKVLFDDIETKRKEVLNPLAHSTVPALTTVEVQAAIADVEALRVVLEGLS